MNTKRFIFNPFGENTYLVWDADTGDGIVIDPGMCSNAEDDMFDSYVAANGIKLRRIINTHLHIDHCWGNAHVAHHYVIQTSAHPDDTFLGEHTVRQARMFGIWQAQIEPVLIDTPLHDGDTVTIGNITLSVLHTPGHSPGSIALYEAAEGIVFVGDTLFAGAVGRTDLPRGNQRSLQESVRTKLFTLPDDTVVYSGHEASTTIGREKASNPYVVA